MNQKLNKSIKTPTNHEQNVDFAFHEFGFFGITQYRIMVFFWILEVLFLPKLLSNAFYGHDASWMKAVYSHTNNFWVVSQRTPTLEYAGVFTIVLALTHPWFIVQLMKKMTIFNYEIQRSLGDYRTIIFCIFIALLSSRMVDLLLDLAEILTMGTPTKSLIIY